MPKLEDLHKEAVKKFGEEPLTGAAEQRYRRVSWPTCVGSTFTSRSIFSNFISVSFQAKPNPAAEHCMRTFLKWFSHASSFCAADASNSVSLCWRAEGSHFIL